MANEAKQLKDGEVRPHVQLAAVGSQGWAQQRALDARYRIRRVVLTVLIVIALALFYGVIGWLTVMGTIGR